MRSQAAGARRTASRAVASLRSGHGSDPPRSLARPRAAARDRLRRRRRSRVTPRTSSGSGRGPASPPPPGPGRTPPDEDHEANRRPTDRHAADEAPQGNALTIRQTGPDGHLLGADDLGARWSVSSTGSENGRVMSDCHRATLRDVGAQETRLRDFAGPGAAVQAVARFVDPKSAWRIETGRRGLGRGLCRRAARRAMRPSAPSARGRGSRWWRSPASTRRGSGSAPPWPRSRRPSDG